MTQENTKQILEKIKFDLFNLLDNSYKGPVEVINKFKDLVKNQPDDFFGKKNSFGHITASGLVIDETGQEVLLTHHGKLHKWLQLGGHWMDAGDGFESVLDAAIREVKEEAYDKRDIPMKLLNSGNIIDLDIHSVGDHYHYDVCFLMEISKKVPIAITNESHDLKWKKISDILLHKENYDERLIRMIEKSQEIIFKKSNKPRL